MSLQRKVGLLLTQSTVYSNTFLNIALFNVLIGKYKFIKGFT
jgi:hypothetical protein